MFIFCLLLFFFLYIMIDAFSNLDEMLETKVTLVTLMQYYLYFLPIIFVQTAPIACLVAGLFTLSNLGINNEVIAMRTAGLSFWQITKPIIYFGLVVSVLIFAANELIVPTAVTQSDKIKNEKMVYEGNRAKQEIIHNFTFFGLKNRLFFINTFNVENKSLEGITILEQDNEQNLKAKVVALSGEWRRSKWTFHQVQIMNFDINGQMTEGIQHFDEKVMDITESPRDFLRQRIQISSMNIKQLNDYINKFRYSGAKAVLRNLYVDINQKIAYPFSNIIILMTGLPFALMTKKRKGLAFASLGLCLVIGFFYYVLNAVALALGKAGVLESVIAAWTANAAFAFLARYLIVKVS
jgi:lipopolysaccharide export system permease protein